MISGDLSISDPDSDRLERDRKLGQIVTLMLTDVERSRMALRNLAIWVIPPIYLQQTVVFYDFSKNAIGYVTWALCSENTSRKMRENFDFVLSASEWNDGRELWIVDLLVRPSGRSQVHVFLVDMLHRFGSVRWVREKRGSRMRHYYIKNKRPSS